METRIVILNYNGEELLPKCLPSIREAVSKASYPTRVTILDNQSTDQGVAYAQKEFPEFEIVRAPENKVLCSYNDYLKEMNEPIAILLNNDIRVQAGFIDPLLKRFEEDETTFLVAPQVMTFDGSQIEAARTKAHMRFGLFWASARYPGYENEAATPSETFASGFGAFSREKFLDLGGYDPRYLPGIMEDADLGFRAAQKGYRSFYEPASVVYHMGQASFKKSFGSNAIEVLAHRNNFLFMWKNFKGLGFWISHLFFLPFRLLFTLLKGNASLLKGFLQALGHKN